MKRFIAENKYRLTAGLLVAAALASAFFFGQPLQKKTAETVASDIVSARSEASEVTPSSKTASSAASAQMDSSHKNESGSAVSSTSETSHSEPESASEKSSSASIIKEENSASSAASDTVEEIIVEYEDIIESGAPEQPEETDLTKSEPETTSEEPAEKNCICTLTISCTNALGYDKLDEKIREQLPDDGIILEEIPVAFSDGDSAFTVLQSVCREKGIPLEYSLIPLSGGAYIEGINNLYELDCGSISGWMFSVNGEFPSVSCSDIKLSEGDAVAFVYTCDLGEDVGNHYVGD